MAVSWFLVEFNIFLLLLHSYISSYTQSIILYIQSNVISCLTQFRGENGQKPHM